MKNNLVKLPVKYNAKRKTKGVAFNEAVIKFPITSFVPVGNPEKYIRCDVSTDCFRDLGINKGDEIIINTFEAVGNGNLIVIKQENKDFGSMGIAKFIGGGKVKLDYIHSTEVFELSEIKIIGRVIKSERSWK